MIAYDVETKKEIQTLARHTSRVVSVAFSVDAKSVVSCSGDSSVIVWQYAENTWHKLEKPHGGPVNYAVFKGSEKEIITTGSDCSIMHWNLP